MFGRKRVEADAPETVMPAEEPNDNDGRRSKRPLVVGAVLAVCLAAGAGFTYAELSRATVDATHPLEYARTLDSDLGDVLVCSSDHVNVSVGGDVDVTTVGVHDVPVRLSLGSFGRDVVAKVEVIDTLPPEISLAATSVEIEMGDELAASTIVEEVTDPVDGSLDEVKEEPKAKPGETGRADLYDEGFYCLTGTDELGEAGTHDVCVLASDSHGNRSEEHVEVVVNDPLEDVKLKQSTQVLEYSKKTLDPVTLVSCDLEGVTIESSGIDLSKVGKTTVEFTLSKGASKRTEKLSFEVRDTKKPTIEVTGDSTQIQKGQSFDRYDIVKSVRDEVDGELARSGKQGKDEGYYSVEGTLDSAVAGVYPLKVVAVDKNGNRTEREVRVEVVEPAPEPAPAPTPAPEARPQTGTGAVQTIGTGTERDYVLNTNTEKFHKPSCRHVSPIYEENREDVHMTREEIISMGYEPCAVCSP